MNKHSGKILDYIKGFILIILIFSIFGTCLYFYGKLNRKGEEVVNVTEVSKDIDKYNYVLNDNVTSYYKDEFNKLKENKELTDQELAEQVAKLFVIDLYSMNYKINKYEITSKQYFYSTKQEMFYQKVLDTFYNNLEDNSYNDRKQALPEVTNVEITDSKKDVYKLDDNTVDAYIISVKISYKEDLGYDKKAKLTLIEDTNEKNMSVVSYKGGE